MTNSIRFLATVLFLFPILSSAKPSMETKYAGEKSQTTFNNGIQWTTGLSWNQLVEKATKEGKYIFVDAYASWCGPCKQMDKDVYPTEAVGNFVNDHFISVKLQMDTSKNDNPLVKQQYPLAARLSKEYKVDAFPTYLFFSPDGKIVHREGGYKIPDQFLALVKEAVDPTKQLYTILEQYLQGKKNYPSMPVLAKAVFTILKDREKAFNITEDYLYNYLDKSNEAEILKKDQLSFIGWLPQSINVKHTYFSILYRKPDLADSIIERKGFANNITDKAIRKEIVVPYLDVKDALSEKDWQVMEKDIITKYDKLSAERIITKEKIAWFTKKNDWQQVISLELERLDKNGLDTSFWGLFGTNNLMYEVVFKHATDNKSLDRAIIWMKRLIDAEQYRNPASIDTYANLLYKAGYREKALLWEEKALAISPNDQELTGNFSKMKAGLPTW